MAGGGHWSLTAWVLARGGTSAALASAGRLGASQAGVRLDYVFDPDAAWRTALYVRASRALVRPAAAEGAIGLSIRHRAVPVMVAIERRVALSPGGRDDVALYAAGGIDRVPVGGNFRIDGYGQAGIVGLKRPDAFVDGRVTVERVMLAGQGGGMEVALGASVWGGAQPGLARLDVGPSVTIRVPIGGATVRIAPEWRARIAGAASPASGPALSIGIDF